MKKFFNDYIGYKGRINRMKFWIYPLITFGIYLLISMIGGFYIMFGNSSIIQELGTKQIELNNAISIQVSEGKSQEEIDNNQEINNLKNEVGKISYTYSNEIMTSSYIQILGLLFTIIYIFLFYTIVIYYIKRLHDLDKSGWMSLLLFVPIVNLYLFVICGFFKGTKGDNRFGPDSLN